MEKNMLTRVRRSALALAVVGTGSMLASLNCWAVDNQFNGSVGTNFNTAANWTPNSQPGSNTVDNYFVQSGLTAVYSGGTIAIHGLVVADDSTGSLNMTGGDLTMAGGGDSFEVGRGFNPVQPNAGGLVDLSGTSILRTGPGPGADNAAVGDRDKGVLHIGPTASVLSPFTYWRVGNFGPKVDAGLAGNGLIDVEGTFRTRALFIGVQDGTGVVQVRGHGSVALTAQADNAGFADIDMDFNHDPVNQPNQHGTIHMIGSTAAMSARNLFSQDPGAPVKNKLWFTADSGGVSDIVLSNAVNITNNALVVDLAGFTVVPGQSILLVDAAPNQITGTFTNISVTGNPFNSQVIYDQPNGNILLQIVVPEPTSIAALAVGATLLIRRRRQQFAGA
jgi:hypothetical protein